MTAAPLAALFLALTLPIAALRPQAFGLPVRIAGIGRCGDVTNIVLTVLPHGDLKLNRESLARGSLDRRLQEVFRTRAYRYVFVIGDPATSFGEVANVVDIAAKQVDHMAILTPSVAKMHTGQNGACIDPNLPPEYIFRPPR
jgi:biopolymer transport protein ExbD